MGRKKVKPPQIDYLKEYAVPRFVTEESICEKYDLSGVQCRKMARAANAFFEIRKAQLIDRTIFEKVYKDQLRERKRQMQTELVLEKAKSYEPVKKEYMRYQEAAEYFSMSMTCFKALAKEANSIRRIGNIVLINIDVVIDYIRDWCLLLVSL